MSSQVEKAWESVYRQRGSDYDFHYELKPSHETSQAVRLMMRAYKNIQYADNWKLYKSNLKAFVHHMGCARAHDDPEENISELRLFLSNSMPFIAQLQKDLQEQIEINKKQQEMITALTFRHLLEHLPPSTYTQKDASANWKKFWMDMVMKELENKRNNPRAVSGHPLEGLVTDWRIMNPIPRVAASTITHTTALGMKGNVWRAGDELYATLSTNIHKYMGAFVVRDDQFGRMNRDIMNALLRINFDRETGGIDPVTQPGEAARIT